MIKGFTIRLYPTKEQEELMWRHIGCARFIWNYMLDVQETRFKNGEKHLPRFDMINLLKPLKNDGEHQWLYEVSNTMLVNVCSDLNESYSRFFKKISKAPKFKSRKRSKPNFPIRSDHLYFTDKTANIEKIGKVKYKTDFDLPLGKGNKFSNARVKFVLNKWYLSFGMECENQAPELTDNKMGIDLGVKDLATVAYGNEQYMFGNINKSKRVREIKKQIKHTQRSISRKYEANKIGNRFVKTSNINRQEERLRRLNARLSNIRKNYIHQTTAFLIKLLPCRVVMEDLNVMGMMKNRHLAKAIQEQNFYEFIRQMKYKCEWNGIEFLQADRFYPSSKTCSCCGFPKKDLRLRDRVFKCPNCGIEINRDYNAAVNLQRYAG